MTVHHMNITDAEFDPSSLTVRQGDQIQFHLVNRSELAEVRVLRENLFEGNNTFLVDRGGHVKTIGKVTGTTTYRLSTKMCPSPDEQTGTMSGSITVIP